VERRTAARGIKESSSGVSSCPVNEPVSSPQAPPVTDLLRAWASGDQAAREAALPLVYDELRRLAAAHLRRERGGHTLQPTALVHEAYLRLVKQDHTEWQNRGQFFGVA